MRSEELTERIETNIRERKAQSLYARYDWSKIAPFDLLDVRDEGRLLPFYLKSIQQTGAIDINDFQIPRKPGLKGYVEWTLKKILWSLLKFYTFRLFSQQKEFNAQVSHTLATMHTDYQMKLDDLQRQVAALKEKANGP